MDFRQNNEPAYYGGARLQRTDDGQLRNVEERHGEMRQLEVKEISARVKVSVLFCSRRILFNCMKFIGTLLDSFNSIMK